MSREESITMAELNRYEVIKSLLDGKLTNKEAGRSLQLTVRQIQRIKKRILEEGVRGVFHGNKGRRPLHAFSAEFKAEAMDLFRQKYFDFNFSHLSDYLLEAEAIKIGRETLRKWLRAAGLGGKKHRQPAHRKRRIRCGKEGQMLFLDGSPHAWFGQVQSTLILCTDDATGKPLYGLFQPQEDWKDVSLFADMSLRSRVCRAVFIWIKPHSLRQPDMEAHIIASI